MITGICKFCGCTDVTPCNTEMGNCCWVDEEQTVCSARPCVTKAYKEAGKGIVSPVLQPQADRLAEVMASWAPALVEPR